jgi:hypothetical protein
MALQIVTATLGGREFEVEAAVDGVTYRGAVPAEVLDDQLGAEAAQRDREAWILGNAPGIETALVEKSAGRRVIEPFDRIELRETL